MHSVFRALGAMVAVSHHCGLIHLKCTGLMTAASMTQLLGWLLVQAREWGQIDAVCCDLSAAMVVATCGELYDQMMTMGRQKGLPMALVVKPQDLELFLGHAWSAAIVGVVRVVFTEHAQAQQWLARQQASRMPPARPGSAQVPAPLARKRSYARRGSRSGRAAPPDPAPHLKAE